MKSVMKSVMKSGLLALAVLASNAQAATSKACNASYDIKLYSTASGIRYSATLVLKTQEAGLTEAKLLNVYPGPFYPQIDLLVGNCHGNDEQATFELVRSARRGEGAYVFQKYTGDIKSAFSSGKYELTGSFQDEYTNGPVSGIQN